jgi:acyl dehydratase
VAVPSEKIGKLYAPVVYAVGREKVREYAAAVGESNPLYYDLEVARAAGHADLPAPPMFVVVYCSSAFMTALFDPELEIDFAHLVHGAQAFEWQQPVVAGDEITTTLSVKDISERAGLGFYTFESVSVNQHGKSTCVGTWSTIVRGEE